MELYDESTMDNFYFVKNFDDLKDTGISHCHHNNNNNNSRNISDSKTCYKPPTEAVVATVFMIMHSACTFGRIFLFLNFFLQRLGWFRLFCCKQFFYVTTFLFNFFTIFRYSCKLCASPRK